MSPLLDFLRARLDEDERNARSTAGDEWHQHWASHEAGDLNEGAIVSMALRVLVEVEAKRRIIDLHRDAGFSQGYTDPPDDTEYGGHAHACTTCGWPGEFGTAWPCPTLRLLALPYAQHPDYLPEWAP